MPIKEAFVHHVDKRSVVGNEGEIVPDEQTVQTISVSNLQEFYHHLNEHTASLIADGKIKVIQR